MKNKLIICADDFGMSQGVNEAILILAQAKKIQAVSILIKQKDIYPVAFKNLSLLMPLELGLHLDLLDDYLGFGLRDVWGLSFSKGVKADLKFKIKDQIAKFNQQFARYPDFIDSHRHLHMLPQVNQILLEVMFEMNLSQSLYLRNTFSGSFFSRGSIKSLGKKFILDFFGFWARGKYRKLSIKTNDSFLGMMNYRSEVFNENFFISQQKRVKGFSLFYVHPAISYKDLIGIDPYQEGRINEFQILLNHSLKLDESIG